MGLVVRPEQAIRRLMSRGRVTGRVILERLHRLTREARRTLRGLDDGQPLLAANDLRALSASGYPLQNDAPRTDSLDHEIVARAQLVLRTNRARNDDLPLRGEGGGHGVGLSYQRRLDKKSGCLAAGGVRRAAAGSPDRARPSLGTCPSSESAARARLVKAASPGPSPPPPPPPPRPGG